MPLRLANFVDSSLEALDRKGNLTDALRLYNPLGAAEKVVHFTAYPDDVRYAPRFADRGIEIFPFFRRRGDGMLQSAMAAPASLLRVVRKVRRERLNVVRGRLPYFSSLLGCLAGRCLGVPAVVSLGGDNRLPQVREGRYYFGSRWLSYGMETTVLRLANVIIVPNRFTKDYVVGVAGSGALRKIVEIPWIIEQVPGAALDAVDLSSTDVASDRQIVLVVGHLNRYKYTLEMFEVAAAVLARRRGSVQFVFCGDGPLRQEGEARLRAEHDVHFLGWKPRETVLALMNRAAIVLVPMSGFVLLEAASLGKPVVTSNVEWHGELVADGETGWLVPPDKIDAWVERIDWILTHADESRAAGSRLRERFQTAYSPEMCLRRELDLYAGLVTP